MHYRATRPIVRQALILAGLLIGLPTGLLGEELPRYIEPSDEAGSAAAVVVGDWPLAHTAQMLPLDDRGELAAKEFAPQFENVLDRLAAALREAQSGLDRIVKLNVYIAREDMAPEVQRVLSKRFAGSHKPAVSLVVTPLPHAGALVAADAVATTALDPGRAVKRLGSVAVIPNGTRIYISGQAERGESLTEATRKTLESLRATLRFLGRRDDDIVELKAFLQPMTDAADVQREVKAFFGEKSTPPLVLVEWKSAAATPIEIELVAWGGQNNSGEPVEFLTPPGMTTSPVFSRVARINHSRTIYVSGLYASLAGDGEREVKQVFASLERILKQGGGDFRHLAKATYYVSTDAASSKLNELRPKYYDPRRPPAASKAQVAGVGRPGLGLSLDMIAVPAVSQERPEYGPAEFGNGLSEEDAAAGWISLFDGKTTFGWKDARIADGLLSSGALTTEVGNCELRANFARGGIITVAGRELPVAEGDLKLPETAAKSGGVAPISLGDGVRLRRLAVRPLKLGSLWNGRDMAQWKRIEHPQIAAEKRPVWQVAEGAMRATGGPGCVEFQEGVFGDMILQLDVRTRLRHANGGVFFRAIPGDFMNGYEAQVFNRGEDGDPARPAIWSTGGLDDFQNARRLVSRDGRFFRMTIVARGPHIATWVNGFQQTDFTDTRAEHVNPRQGRRTEPGVIQLQAHDPGTVVEFKNIAAATW